MQLLSRKFCTNKCFYCSKKAFKVALLAYNSSA
nr:MAG TPA: Radical SAM superfamily [Crassvirales sp.]